MWSLDGQVYHTCLLSLLGIHVDLVEGMETQVNNMLMEYVTARGDLLLQDGHARRHNAFRAERDDQLEFDRTQPGESWTRWNRQSFSFEEGRRNTVRDTYLSAYTSG